MSRLFAVAACLTLGLWNAPAHASQDCPSLEGWQVLFDEDGLSCFESEHGLAIAPAGLAEPLAKAMDAAWRSHGQHFGAPQTRVAVIARSALRKDQSDFVASAGFSALPWLDPVSRNRLKEETVRRQVEAQAGALPPEARQALVRQALDKLSPDRHIESSLQPIELGAAAHEAGHVLFAVGFPDTRGSAVEGRRRYGSAAPDWLDELAAVLAENLVLTASRYATARNRIAAGKPALPVPLADYLTMEHPSLAAANLLANRSQQGTETSERAVFVLSGEEARRFMDQSSITDPGDFYLQTRLLADFLLATSGNPRIFEEITKVIGSGGNFFDWLESSSVNALLPASPHEFEQALVDWVELQLRAE